MPRNTLTREVRLGGIGMHTGASANVTVMPAPSGSGIVFRRTDLPERPRVPARLGQVKVTERRTGLAAGDAHVDTVEHLLAATQALALDDLMIDIDGPELPMLDGSFLPWLDLLRQGGTTEQSGDPAVITLHAPVTVVEGEARYVAAPSKGLTVTATVDWNHPAIGRQSLSHTLSANGFASDIAPARTFGFVHEVAALRERGLLQGATAEMAVVLTEQGVANGPLRWPDEFVRHKLGDILGDLALLGARVEAWIVAERPSHQGNVALARALARQAQRADPSRLNIDRILAVLPHRFPFLLVDRIVEIEAGRRIVGIKNVTINEPFFQGHFPGHPIMPGVLIVEAMAQAGGMLLMDSVERPESKVVYFMAIDDVKFRKPVLPGDQLRFEVELVQMRGRICRTRGRAFVDGQVVCEAEMMASVVDR
jgi:UDP-3-O-[3-hydroxymyristoyl] N-acetylglucosamine deacetylase/3-hydroxyacyl-[acyl-carrier-protein] dehydratase